jgi:hypothetical protein
VPRWLRVIRGMFGTGFVFALGVGAASGLITLVAMLFGKVTLLEALQVSGKLGAVAGLVGVAFSGVLALTARGKSFGKLSLPFVSALGAVGGFLYFLFIGFANGFRVWNTGDLVANLVLLTVIGSAAAAGTLVIARKAGKALGAGDEPGSLGEGNLEDSLMQHDHERERVR